MKPSNRAWRWGAGMAAALAVLALFRWWPVRPDTPPLPSTTTPSHATAPQQSDPPAAPAKSSRGVRGENKEVDKRELLREFNDREIRFYGRVLDEHDHPLAGVGVSGTVIYNNGSEQGVRNVSTSTNADGLFTISGVNGRTLGIDLAKEGYGFRGAGPFQFSQLFPTSERHEPDAARPVILKMWSLTEAQPLVHGRMKSFQLSPTGDALNIDLLTGRAVASGGDVILRFHGNLSGKVAEGGPFDWSLLLAANGGGVRASPSTDVSVAPSDGYAQSAAIEMNLTAPDWDNTVDRAYFVKSRNRLYSRLIVHFNASANPQFASYVTLTWWTNPSGSTSLVEDANRAIDPGASGRVAEPSR
jgi:hypothetical protein